MEDPLDEERFEVLRPSRADPAHGRKPEERSIEELFSAGAVIIDKPHGPTSHQVAHWVKGILGIEKAGHMGTLDPNTTGVLPIALGSAVRVLEMTLSEGKEYIALMRLHRDVDDKLLGRIVGEFTGEIYQMVPVRSAVKRGLRTRRIHYMKVLERRERDVLLLVGCQSGTYIRTLIHDMGEVMGVGANMAELRRTRSGTIHESMACTLQDLKDAWEIYRENGEEGLVRKVIVPYERLLEHLPRIVIKDSSVDAICHGAPLGNPGIVALERSARKGETALLITLKGEAIALVEVSMEPKIIIKARSGEAAHPTRVLMAPGTYPRRWKRSQPR